MSQNGKGSNSKYGVEIGDKSTGNVMYISAIKLYTPVLSPALVALNTTTEQLFTVTGLKVTDIVENVIKPTSQAGLGIVGMRVSAANTLAITFSNNSAAGITPTPSEIYQIITFSI